MTCINYTFLYINYTFMELHINCTSIICLLRSYANKLTLHLLKSSSILNLKACWHELSQCAVFLSGAFSSTYFLLCALNLVCAG